MPKHKNSDILTSIQDVSQLMQQDKTDAEIISILNIPQRTLTRYNSQFHLLGQGAGNDLRVYIPSILQLTVMVKSLQMLIISKEGVGKK